VDGLRGTLISAFHFGATIDVAVLAMVALMFLGIGTYFFSRIEI
jgi:hypothetical protein